MPVSISWFDDEKKILLYEMEGVWTWEEFYPVYEEALQMEIAQPHRVDVIIDLRKNRTLPTSVLLHIKGIADRQPDNLGVSVLVTQNRAIIALYKIGVQLYESLAKYFDVAPSVDEAVKRIQTARGDVSAES
jgi:hypothetical protein